MLWLWILLAVLGLLVLLCLTRVGVWAAYDGAVFRLSLRIGPLRVQVLPPKPKKKKEKAAKKEKKPPKEKPEKEGKRSFTLEDGKDAFHTLLPPLKRALARTRRGLHLKPFRLSLILGGQEDPAAAAQAYGGLEAAVWVGMPRLEKLLDIPDPRIHMDVDFTASAPAVEGEVGAAFRIGTLLAVGFGLAFPALGWFLRWRKRSRPPKEAAEKAA